MGVQTGKGEARMEEARLAGLGQQAAAAVQLAEAQAQVEALKAEVESQGRSIKNLEATLVHKNAQIKIVQVLQITLRLPRQKIIVSCSSTTGPCLLHNSS